MNSIIDFNTRQMIIIMREGGAFIHGIRCAAKFFTVTYYSTGLWYDGHIKCPNLRGVLISEILNREVPL